MAKRLLYPEFQSVEYQPSWQDGYLQRICGYANARGGKLYVGANDDGYVVGMSDARFLLDELPDKITSSMGIIADIDHGVVDGRGENLKYVVVPRDIANKPQNLSARGLLTGKVVEEIDADPADTQCVSPDVGVLLEAAPELFNKLRTDADFRCRVIENLRKWEAEATVCANINGLLEYVCITVRSYPYGIAYNGHYYLRSGGVTREMAGLELSTFLSERAGMHWDGMPMHGLSVSDLDHAAIEAYRRKAVSRGRHTETDVAVSDEQILLDLKLIYENGEGAGELMRAAILLFHAEPDRFVTGATVKVAYFAPVGAYGANKYDDIIYQDEVSGPLMLQADRIIDLVYAKYLKPFISYEGSRRIDTFMIPKEVFREVILNAIGHKLYESGNPIQVSVYDDRIIVFNQGHWPADIDLSELYVRNHPSHSHNPSLSRVFFNAGEIGVYGGGFEKIRIECDKYGAPYPEISITPNGVTVEIKPRDVYMKMLEHGCSER